MLALGSVTILLLPTLISTTDSEECEEGEYKCFDYNGTFSFDTKCIINSWLCDDIPDCPFGDDEHNCPSCNLFTGFICSSTQTCIPYQWSCATNDTVWDCPNQEDVSQQTCDQLNPNYKDCKDDPNYFKCTNTNGRCIPIENKCNGELDCLDGQDESVVTCTNFQPRPTPTPSYSLEPSFVPSILPTDIPTNEPTDVPITLLPTVRPTIHFNTSIPTEIPILSELITTTTAEPTIRKIGSRHCCNARERLDLYGYTCNRLTTIEQCASRYYGSRCEWDLNSPQVCPYRTQSIKTRTNGFSRYQTRFLIVWNFMPTT